MWPDNHAAQRGVTVPLPHLMDEATDMNVGAPFHTTEQRADSFPHLSPV
jgi:hypothetical protein